MTRKKETENSAVVPAEVEVLPATTNEPDQDVLKIADPDVVSAYSHLGLRKPPPKLGRAILGLYYSNSALSKGFKHDKTLYKVLSFDGETLMLESPVGEILIKTEHHPKYGLIGSSVQTNEPNVLTRRAIESLAREPIDSLAEILSESEFVKIIGGVLRVLTHKRLEVCKDAAKGLYTQKALYIGHSVKSLLPSKPKTKK